MPDTASGLCLKICFWLVCDCARSVCHCILLLVANFKVVFVDRFISVCRLSQVNESDGDKTM